jgi:hypothetical protein
MADLEFILLLAVLYALSHAIVWAIARLEQAP